MKIWLINQYNSLPEHGHFTRNFYLAKHLKAMGHEPVVLAGSSPHNSETQLINGNVTSAVDDAYGFPYIYVKTGIYGHNKKKQVLEMFRFYWNTKRTVKSLPCPDVIVGSSMHPLAALLAIRLAKKYLCKGVVEIRDLWPESMFAYGLLTERGVVGKLMYAFEKYLYTRAHAIIFTMEGARDYLLGRGLDMEHGGSVDMKKVFYVNNGVDLTAFDQSAEAFPSFDPDLHDSSTFKVVYTGSIRRVNGIDLIIDAARELRDTCVKFLIWGTGSDLDLMRDRCHEEDINNVIFKGFVSKNLIPGIIKRADLLLLNYKTNPTITRYGSSQNKLFEYMAAGKPILSNAVFGYDLINRYDCGASIDISSGQEYARIIKRFLDMDSHTYAQICANARKAASNFDFGSLTEKYVEAISR